MPYPAPVKMTMHIDEEALAEVMKITGVSSKTKAVELALKEILRRRKLYKTLRHGLGLSKVELKAAYDPASEAALGRPIYRKPKNAKSPAR